MKNKIKLSVIVIVIIVLCLFKGAYSFIANRSLALKLDAIEKSSQYKVGYIVYDEVHNGQTNSLNLKNICLEQDKNYKFMECLAAVDQNYYIVYSETDKKTWNLASVSITGENFETLYTIKFQSFEKFFYEYGWNVANYSQKSGFYYERKIILQNKNRVFEYSLDNGTCTEYEYGNYVFPMSNVQYDIIDGQKIQFKIDGEDKIISFSDFKMQDDIKELYELKDNKIWNGSCSYVDNFFHSVQLIDGEIYILGWVLNYTGHAYATILHYDIIENECTLVDYFYTDSYASIYLVNV